MLLDIIKLIGARKKAKVAAATESVRDNEAEAATYGKTIVYVTDYEVIDIVAYKSYLRCFNIDKLNFSLHYGDVVYCVKHSNVCYMICSDIDLIRNMIEFIDYGNSMLIMAHSNPNTIKLLCESYVG